MLELPFKRKGRRKNASLDESLLFGRDSSFKGRLGDEGRRFSALRTRSIERSLFDQPGKLCEKKCEGDDNGSNDARSSKVLSVDKRAARGNPRGRCASDSRHPLSFRLDGR